MIYQIKIIKNYILIDKSSFIIDDSNDKIYNFKYNNLESLLLKYKTIEFKQFMNMIYKLIINEIKFIIGFDKFYFYIITININNLKIYLDDTNNNINTEIYNSIDFNNSKFMKLTKVNSMNNIYKYNNNIIKITSSIKEIINYFVLLNKIRSLNLSIKLIEVLNVILFISKKNENSIGIVMPEYNNLPVKLDKQILFNFTKDIQKMNENKIYLMDLKYSNVLWDNNIVVIDYESIQFDCLNLNNYITSIYNTHIDILLQKDVDLLNLDVYGVLDIVLYYFNIIWNKLISILFKNGYNNIEEYRKFLYKMDNNRITKKMIDKYLYTYNVDKKISNLISNILEKALKSTITYEDIFNLINLL